MNERPFSQKIVDYIVSKPMRSLLIVAGIILIPLIVVHIFFPANGPYCIQTKLLAGDVLGYLGSILGAIATIVAIVFTIQLTVDERRIAEKNETEKQRLAIRPYLQSSHRPILTENDFISVKAKKPIYIDFLDGDPNSLHYSSTSVPSNIGEYENQIDYYRFLYSIQNVGAGNAIETKFKFNDKTIIPSFALSVDKEINFVFLFNVKTLSVDNNPNYFTFEYTDVASVAKYQQQEKIVIYVHKEHGFIEFQNENDLISSPQIMSKN